MDGEIVQLVDEEQFLIIATTSAKFPNRSNSAWHCVRCPVPIHTRIHVSVFLSFV
jgi:hypothetical protein